MRQHALHRSGSPLRGAVAGLRVARSAGLIFLAGVLLYVSGCAGTDTPRPVQPDFDLHHPDAVRRTLAIQDVAARQDRRWLPDLIELLDDRDETVRLQAGAAMREITGHDVGYQAFAGPSERRAAIAAWQAYLQSTAQPAPPDVAQPDVAPPDVAQPDVAQPDVAQPGALRGGP